MLASSFQYHQESGSFHKGEKAPHKASLKDVVEEYKATLQSIDSQISPGRKRLKLVEKDFDTFENSLIGIINGIKQNRNSQELQVYIHNPATVIRALNKAINHLTTAFGSMEDINEGGRDMEERADGRNAEQKYLDRARSSLAEALRGFS